MGMEDNEHGNGGNGQNGAGGNVRMGRRSTVRWQSLGDMDILTSKMELYRGTM